MYKFLDDAIASSEVFLEGVATTVREGIKEKTSTVLETISETDFYKSTFAYIPEEEEGDNKGARPTVVEPATATDEEGVLLLKSPHSSPQATPPRSLHKRNQSSQDSFSQLPRNSSFASTSSSSTPLQTTFSSIRKRKPSAETSNSNSNNNNNNNHHILNSIEAIPIQERIEAAQHSIGWLSVKIGKIKGLSIDGSFLPDITRPYLKIKLGKNQEWVSKVAEEDTNMPGEFSTFTNVSLDFVAQDIHSDLFVKIYQKNIITRDRKIGTVVIPLNSILPKVKEAFMNEDKRSIFKSTSRVKPYNFKSWFEFYPVPEEWEKLTPAAHDIDGTGMNRPPFKLGFIELSLALHLHGKISMWAGYAMPLCEEAVTNTKPKLPVSGDIKAITEVVESGKRFKRNFMRVKIAFSRFFSRGQNVWPAVKFVKDSRSWENPTNSVFCLCVAFYVLVFCPTWMFPLNSFFLLVASTSMIHGKHEKEREYVVWNDQIRDPDNELGQIQKVAKLIYLMEKFEKYMGIMADYLERLCNVFSFADERVTLGVLLFVGIVSCILSLLLFFSVTYGYLSFVAFLGWFFLPVLQQSNAKAQQQEEKEEEEEEEGEGEEGKQAVTVEEDTQETIITDKELRSGGRLKMLFALFRLAKRGPSLIFNIFKRIPTDDELGHRFISSLQVVREPVIRLPPPPSSNTSLMFFPELSPPSGGDDDADNVWLREY